MKKLFMKFATFIILAFVVSCNNNSSQSSDGVKENLADTTGRKQEIEQLTSNSADFVELSDDYAEIKAKQIVASSSLKSQGANNYESKNLGDGDFSTTWVEGVASYGIGEYVQFYFAPTTSKITTLVIANGYHKSGAALKNNSKVKTLKMYVNDVLHTILNLEDETLEGNGQQFDLKKPIDGKGQSLSIKLEIVDVYKGSKFDDVAISEVIFYSSLVSSSAREQGSKSTEELLEGSWQSIEDENSSMTFEGNTWYQYYQYEGKPKADETVSEFRLSDRCINYSDKGKKHSIVGDHEKASYLNDLGEDLCYYIVRVTDVELELSLVGGTGNSNRYKRID